MADGLNSDFASFIDVRLVEDKLKEYKHWRDALFAEQKAPLPAMSAYTPNADPNKQNILNAAIVTKAQRNIETLWQRLDGLHEIIKRTDPLLAIELEGRITKMKGSLPKEHAPKENSYADELTAGQAWKEWTATQQKTTELYKEFYGKAFAHASSRVRKLEAQLNAIREAQEPTDGMTGSHIWAPGQTEQEPKAIAPKADLNELMAAIQLAGETITKSTDISLLQPPALIANGGTPLVQYQAQVRSWLRQSGTGAPHRHLGATELYKLFDNAVWKRDIITRDAIDEIHQLILPYSTPELAHSDIVTSAKQALKEGVNSTKLDAWELALRHHLRKPPEMEGDSQVEHVLQLVKACEEQNKTDTEILQHVPTDLDDVYDKMTKLYSDAEIVADTVSLKPYWSRVRERVILQNLAFALAELHVAIEPRLCAGYEHMNVGVENDPVIQEAVLQAVEWLDLAKDKGIIFNAGTKNILDTLFCEALGKDKVKTYAHIHGGSEYLASIAQGPRDLLLANAERYSSAEQMIETGRDMPAPWILSNIAHQFEPLKVLGTQGLDSLQKQTHDMHDALQDLLAVEYPAFLPWLINFNEVDSPFSDVGQTCKRMFGEIPVNTVKETVKDYRTKVHTMSAKADDGLTRAFREAPGEIGKKVVERLVKGLLNAARKVEGGVEGFKQRIKPRITSLTRGADEAATEKQGVGR